MTKIYESPDKGKTVFEREFGSTERTRIPTKDDLYHSHIQKIARIHLGLEPIPTCAIISDEEDDLNGC